MLQKTVKEVIAGHQYLNIQIKGQAHTGDAYSSDWSGGAIGESHKYNDIKVEEGGKAFVGNKYGVQDEGPDVITTTERSYSGQR